MYEIYSQYRAGVHSFPKHDIDPKLKLEPEWHRLYCKAILSSWINGKTGISYAASREFARLRALGAGEQPTSYYQDILLDDQEANDGARKGWMNVSWEIFSVAPKFKNVVIGMFEAQDHDISASAVDPVSGLEREEAKWNLWFDATHQKEMGEVRKNMGIPSSEDSYLPQTLQELQLFQDLGGFKLGKEAAIEMGIDYTFYISDWAEIKRQLLSDAMDLGVIAVKDYVDIETQKVRCEYSDPATTIIQYSKFNDHRTSSFGGRVIDMTISELRQKTDLDEDELEAISEMYAGYNDITSMGGRPQDQLLSDGDGHKYDFMIIKVLDAEIISVNSEYRMRHKNARGESNYYAAEYGKVYNSNSKKTEISKKRQVYRSKLIIGTDHVFDHGYQYDVPRPGKKEVRLSLHVYRMKGRSMTSLMEPNLHNLQLAWLKFQNNLAQSSAPGLAVEYSTLQNMLLGGKKMEPIELLTVRRDTGDLVYRATTHRGIVNNPHAGKPVQELKGGMGESLDEFIKIFNMNLEFIRDLTGINRITDASSPNPNQSVGGSEIAVIATNNALRPMYAGYISIKERTALNIALRLQILVKHSKQAYKGYYPVLGQTNLKLLSLGADIVDADYAIKIEARPNDEMKQVVRQAALEAMKPDRDGFVGMEMPDYLMIERLMDLGNLKLAQALLSERIRRNKEIQILKQRENMQLDAKREQEALKLKDEIEGRKQSRDFEGKKDLEDRKHDNKMEQLDKIHGHKIREMQVEKAIEVTVDNLNNEQEGTTPKT